MPPKAIAVFTGDNHLRPSTWAKHPTLYGDAYESWRQIIGYADRHMLPLLLLGDLFDSARPDSLSVGQYLHGVAALEQSRVPVHYIEGNHDQADPPWPSLSAWARPVGKFMLGDIPAYGLSFTTAGDLPHSLAAIPVETRLLLCHQSWQEIQRVGHCDGAFSMIPHGLVMLTGDYHVCGTYTGTAANGETVIAHSPGSTAMQALNEPPAKYFGVLYDDLSVSWAQLATRPFISVTVNSEQELAELVERLRSEQMVTAGEKLPYDIQKPIVRVRYTDTIPEAYSRLLAVGEAYHLFLEPQRQTTTHVVDVQAAPQTAFHSLMSAVAELCPPATQGYNAARRLLESTDPKTELDALFSEFKIQHATAGNSAGVPVG